MLKDYFILLKFYLLFLAIGVFARTILYTFFSDQILDLFFIYLYGIRMDTIVFSIFALFSLPLIFLKTTTLLRIYFTFIFTLYLAFEFLNFFFFEQYGSRVNFLFFEYLSNYREVIGTIVSSHGLQLFILGLLIIGSAIFFHSIFHKLKLYGKFLHHMLFFPIALVILFIGIRSSFDSSTPNPSFHSFSASVVSNEIAGNSLFSLFYALYSSKKEEKIDFISSKKAIQIAQNFMNEDFLNTHSLRKKITKENHTEPKNVILIMLESFGAKNVGYLGGTPSTPHLDKLIAQGILFENIYATGSRTHWGVSAILSSLYSPYKTSYLKLPKSQKNFYTIASSFQKNHYKNIFVYGGDSSFDNMSGFLLNNGFDTIYDKFSFNSHQSEKSKWGYNDGVLYDKIIELIKQQKKPYFISALTLSSHEPFDYPDANITLLKQYPKESFANSTIYADQELWRFYTRLKEENLLENTLLAFVSDHGASIHGDIISAVDNNKIVGLILGDTIEPQRYTKISSQVDFAATLLDMSNIEDQVTINGTAINKKNTGGAIMNYLDNIICIEDSKTFVYNKATKRYFMYDSSKKMIEDDFQNQFQTCFAQLQVASDIYLKNSRK